MSVNTVTSKNTQRQNRHTNTRATQQHNRAEWRASYSFTHTIQSHMGIHMWLADHKRTYLHIYSHIFFRWVLKFHRTDCLPFQLVFIAFVVVNTTCHIHHASIIIYYFQLAVRIFPLWLSSILLLLLFCFTYIHVFCCCVRWIIFRAPKSLTICLHVDLWYILLASCSIFFYLEHIFRDLSEFIMADFNKNEQALESSETNTWYQLFK